MDKLPASTNACPTSPTTDIQPELLPVIRYVLEWRNENSKGKWKRSGAGGFPVPGERCRSRYLYDRDAAVFEMGADNPRWVAGIEHRVVQITETVVAEARHGATTRLTSTTPTLGNMVMVPREPTEAMIVAGERAAWDDHNSMPAVRAMPLAWSAMIAAASASPVSTSANGAGERKARSLRDHAIALLRARLGESRTRVAVLNAREVTSILAALSPALDNTAVKGRSFSEPSHQQSYDALRGMPPNVEEYRAMGGGGNAYVGGYEQPDKPTHLFPKDSKAYALWAAGVDNAKDDCATLTAETEKAR